jgi:hypothetical protein
VRLFDDFVRIDSSPGRHGEDTYSFLNRVDGRAWGELRRILDGWLANCPVDQQQRLLPRFKARVGTQFLDAFWELYLHEVLRRAGFRIRHEAEVAGTLKTPDYHASRETDAFYLEATVLHDPSDESTDERRTAPIYHAVDSLDSPAFFVGVEEAEVGVTAPPLGELRRDLARWLQGLDPDHYSGIAYDVLPRMEWRRSDCWLLLVAIPKKFESRGKPGACSEIGHDPGPAPAVGSVDSRVMLPALVTLGVHFLVCSPLVTAG